MKRKTACLLWILAISIAFSASGANALEINLIPANGVSEKVTLDTGKFFSKNISVEYGEAHVKIEAAAGSYARQVQLYLCKNSDPVACSKTHPLEFSEKADIKLKLDEIEGSGGVANLLTLLKVNDSVFAGFDTIERGVVKDNRLDAIDAYIKADAADVKKYIEESGMVPLNLVDRVNFGGRNIHELVGEVRRAGGSYSINITGAKTASSIEADAGYLFAFPFSKSVYSPIVFDNVPRICGDAVCDKEESYRTCWYDCACPGGQVPSASGCVPKSDVSLIVDNVDKVACFTESISTNPGSNNACNAFRFDISFHLNNVPVNYSVFPASHFYEFQGSSYTPDCRPDDPEFRQYSADTLKYLKRYNASRYTCSYLLPAIQGVHNRAETRSMLIGLYMNVLTKEGEETVLASNTTALDIDVNGIADLDLQSIKDKLNNKPWWQKDGEHYIVKPAQAINNAFRYAESALIGCAVLANAVPGGTAVADACAAKAGSITPEYMVISMITKSLELAIDMCFGQPLEKPATPLTPLLDVGEIDKAFNSLGLDKIPGAEFIFGQGRLISQKRAESVAKKMNGFADFCGQAPLLEDKAKQKIKESDRSKRVEVENAAANLVWAKGNVSGKSQTVCGNEDVKAFYDFSLFGCDDLWFNFNSRSRPLCNGTTSEWINPNPVFSGTCAESGRAGDYDAYYTDLAEGRTFSRAYNTTGTHLLFDKPANELFEKPVDGATLNLTLYCKSPAFGDVEPSEFTFLEYSEACQ